MKDELKPCADRELLYRIFMNSTLWDACVLEAYEGDVRELIENILFAGYTRTEQGR